MKKRDSQYWHLRLVRDHPEVAEKLEAGEIASVRAACIEVGFVKRTTGTDELRRAWARASAEERRDFLAEVSGKAGVGDLTGFATEHPADRTIAFTPLMLEGRVGR